MSSRTVQSNDCVQRGGVGRRLLAALMSIILVIGLMPTLALPQLAYAADEPAKNADGAYELGSADDLTWFADHVNEGGDNLQADAVLTADINLGSVAWTPIAGGSNCAYDDCYKGTFDGAGYTVTLNDSSRASSSTDAYWGLFGAVGVNTQTGEGGLIKNLTLDGSFTASGVACAAGFTAVSYGARIYSCTNNMNITTSSSSAFTSYGTAAAGIVAYDYSSTIVNCGNTGNISVSYTGSGSSYGSQAGGIIGDQYDLSKCADFGGRTCIENCYNQGAITSTVTDYAYYARAGGIAGHTYSGAEDDYIVNCYSSGATTASHNYSSYQQAGGIVGLAYGPYNGADGNPRFLYLTNCYWADTSLAVDNEDSFAHGNIEKERTNPYTDVSELLSDLEFVTESPAGASGVTYESWILGENGLPCLSGKAVEKDVASVTVGGTTTTYTDFAEALTAANAGTSGDPATLTLLADADMGTTEGSLIGYVTFDLAGYTLTGDAYNMIEIGNQGQLTIEDTSAAGTGTITSTTCGAIAISSGSVIVNSGTVKTPCVSFSDNGTAVSSVWEYAPIRTLYGTAVNFITINGGTIESMETYDEEDDVTVYGGEAIDLTSYASGTTLEITGGTITGGSGWFGSRATVYVSNGNYTNPASTAPTVNIVGGTITTSDTSKNAIELTAYANTTVGIQSTENVLEPRVAGAIYSYATSSAGVYPNIYSGLYTQAPNANYIPSGYECVDYTAVEGYSYLVRQEAVEMYDVNVGYFSHGAITADPTRAAAGDTVTLTIAPDTDYRLASGSLKVSYTDASGTAQTITPDGSGTTYTFEMPAANVTVTAEFEVAPLWEGSGTEDDPYQIWTADDLNNLARKVNTGTTYSYTYFEVMDDITVDEGWIAIGYSSNYHFGGTFDGNLHVITLNVSYTDDAAYRTHIGETYELSSGAFYGTTYLGLFGYLYYSGTTSNIPTVKNVIVDGTLESYDTTYGMNVGGIAGELYYGRIINCENRATISATGDSAGDYAGGIAGQIYSVSTEVINVYSSGNVTAGQSGGTINRAGGITGNLNPSSVRVSNAVISEDCVITQNGEVRSPSGVSRLFGYYSTSSLGYENAYDRAYIDSGDISQSDLDNWNKMSLGYAPNVLEFWVLDDIQKPIPNADASTATVYKVNIGDAENGSIETDVPACAEGGTVKVTLTPADGYEFESITVTRDDGLGTVEVTEGDTNVFRFEMPASDVTVSATFTKAPEPTTYTVAFDGNGGSSTESQTVEEGQCATRPADPTREGYLFTGWYTDAACTDLFDFSTPIMGDITLYAGWARDERTIYTVTFDSQGGSEVASQSVAEGECVTRPADPTWDGYTFTGWYTDEACTTAFDFATPITGDITLYAGWQRVPTGDEVTVTFDTNGGTQIPSQQVVRGECATQPPDPEKEGYEFIGWFSDEACTQPFDFSTPIQMSTIIYAGWVPAEYYITIVNSEGGTITASQSVADEGDKIEITVVPDDGYELETLMMTDGGGAETEIGQDADGNYTFLMPASDVEITATWKETETPEPEPPTPTTHEITIDPVDHASVSVDPSVAAAGDTVTITVTLEDDYTVDSVTVTATNGDEVKVTAGDNGTYTFTMPDSDVAVEVKVSESSEPPTPEPTPEPEEHTIAVSDGDTGHHGTITVEAEAEAGAKVTITVIAEEGYTLTALRFFDADTEDEITSLCDPVQTSDTTWSFTMPSENVIITPVWEEEPTPTPTPEPEKIQITTDMFEVDTTYGIYDGTDPVTKTISSDLVEGTDYTVTYANNTSAGEATITIEGIGDYTGTLEYTFKVIHYFEDVGAAVNDVNEWYFDAVYGMVDLGAITGYNETIFGVGDSMSRAQLVTIMWRYCEPEEYAAYDEPAAKDTTGLPDAADGMYYTGAVNWAYANSVITGNQHEDGTYTLNPDDPVTFEQMVTILARYCLGSFDEAADYPQTALNDGNFTDADTVESFARGSMSWAIANGVVTGNNNGDGTWTLSPLEDVARERAVTVLYRSINEGLL